MRKILVGILTYPSLLLLIVLTSLLTPLAVTLGVASGTMTALCEQLMDAAESIDRASGGDGLRW